VNAQSVSIQQLNVYRVTQTSNNVVVVNVVNGLNTKKTLKVTVRDVLMRCDLALRYSLKSHLSAEIRQFYHLQHEDVKLSVCSGCQSVFMPHQLRIFILKSHQLLHLNTSIFGCRWCGKTFKCKAYWHVLIHFNSNVVVINYYYYGNRTQGTV